MVKSERDQIEGSAAQSIKNCLTAIRTRMYRQALLQTVTTTFFYGLVLLAILFLLNRVILLPMQMSNISWFIIAVAVGVGICLSLKHRKDLSSIARTVDEKMELAERLGTASELMQVTPQTEFAQLQIRDAAETVTTLDLKKISPYCVPKFLKLFPIPLLLIGLSFTISPFYEIPQPLTTSQQQALDKTIHGLEGKHVKNATLQTQINDTVKALKAAIDLNTAQKHLSTLKKEVRKQQSEQNAISEATAASQSFRGMDANQLIAVLENLTEQVEIPPELQAELASLFQHIAEKLPQGELHDALNQIQSTAVTPETLAAIINALEKAENVTDLAQLEAQLTANQKALALATLEVETSGGGIANSDGAPGQQYRYQRSARHSGKCIKS